LELAKPFLTTYRTMKKQAIFLFLAIIQVFGQPRKKAKMKLKQEIEPFAYLFEALNAVIRYQRGRM
jgi:hypothetical protein